MVLVTSEIGMRIKQMARVNLCMQTGMSMKGAGSMTKPTGSVFTSIRTEPSTKALGKMIFKMERALRYGPMAASTKVAIRTGWSTVEATISGMMAVSLTVTGSTIRSAAVGNTHGQMAGHTQASGWKITCTEKAFTHGKMAVDTTVNTRMIVSMGTGLTHGRINASMKAIGKMENSTEKVSTDR